VASGAVRASDTLCRRRRRFAFSLSRYSGVDWPRSLPGMVGRELPGARPLDGRERSSTLQRVMGDYLPAGRAVRRPGGVVCIATPVQLAGLRIAGRGILSTIRLMCQ
jgi:hypothetical protein